MTGDFNTTNAHPIVHSNPAYETTQIVGVMENPAYITTHRHSPFSTGKQSNTSATICVVILTLFQSDNRSMQNFLFGDS